MKQSVQVLKKRKGIVKVIKDLCKGCGYCIEFCPVKVLEFSHDVNIKGYHYPIVKKGMEDKCIACKICEKYCPDFAIYIEEV